VCGQSQAARTNTDQTEVAVARQRAGRSNADETEVEQTEVDLDAAESEEAAEFEDESEGEFEEESEGEFEEESEPVAGDGDDVERSAETDAFWESTRIDLVEIALPKGIGYTLRAYRPDTEITPTDISDREADAFPERHGPLRSFVPDEKAVADYEEEEEDEPEAPRGRRRRGAAKDKDDEIDDAVDEDEIEDEDALDESDDDEEAEGEDEDDEADSDAAQSEDIPVFLGARGKLYLFRTPEGLVDFVRSGAEHDLSQLAAWPEVVERITVDDVVPRDEDRYELDLVVENLRGGYDAWDPDLLIQAGEIARDLAYALRLQSVQDSLAPGSPMDDLDEVMRTAAGGGFSGFFARRKLKKIGAEAAPLSWRTIIGKISAAVDWRD
jgi:hypothetical protein